MKNKLLKSSTFVFCAGIITYIISLSFFSAFNTDYYRGQKAYLTLFPIHFHVPIYAIQDQYFPGFIFFRITLALEVIGGILLLIGYFKDRVDERRVLITSIVVIFFGIGFSFITLAKFIKFDGYIPGSLDTSLSPHVYIISQIILGYYFIGYNIWPISLGLIIIGIILLLLALFSKKKPEKNEIKEKISRNKLLKSSIFVFCAGIVFYIISFLSINEPWNPFTHKFIFQLMMEEYFSGFVAFIIASVLEVTGGILLFIRCLI